MMKRCLVVLCLLLLLSCEAREQYAGTYKAMPNEMVKQEIMLELKANGEGLWRVGSKDVFTETPVVWYLKHGDLRVDTKEGGVILGKIEKDTIEMTLPALGPLTFKKTP
ncbi:MAG: hypothetical protein ABSD38_30880 [Syntrophorhabdales bacterium]|jgi:hypothetical protein